MSHKITELIGYFFLILLILFAIGLCLVRLFLLNVELYKSDIENKISELISIPIEIGQLKGHMHGIEPGIILTDIHVLATTEQDKPAIQFSEVRMGINLLKFMFTGQVLPSCWVTITGAELTIVRKADGSFAINGLTADDSGQPLWLLETGSYKLLNSEISWLDLQKNKSLVTLSHVDLLIKNSLFKQSHELHLISRLPEKYGGGVRVSVSLQGGDPLNKNNINANTYIEAKNIQFAPFLAQFDKALPLSIILSEGKGDARIWSRWDNSTLTSISANVKANNLIFHKEQHSFQINELSTSIKSTFRNTTEKNPGWQIDVSDFALTTLTKIWPQATFSFSTNTQLTEFAASIGQLDLQELAELTHFFGTLDDENQTLLATLQPKGLLKNTQIYGDKENNKYAVKGEFEQVSINSIDTFPQIHNLTGSIQGTNDYGSINLDTHAGTFFLPSLFRRELSIKHLTGLLSWQQQEDALLVNSDSLILDTNAFRTNNRFSLTIPNNDKPIFIDLQSSLDAEDISQLSNYYPVKVMDSELVNWLKTAFPAGKLNRGQLLVYGKMDEFPFDNGQGVFETIFNLTEVELDYAPEWPLLSQLEADIFLFNNSLSVDVAHAEWNGLTKQAQLKIPSLSKSTHLIMQEQIKGNLSNELKYMQQTPLKSIADNILESINPQGLAQIDLDLEIPLVDGEQVLVEGVIRFFDKKTSLNVKALNLEVTNIEGTIEVTEKGLSSNNLKAKALGYPIALKIQDNDSFTLIDIAGETDFLKLKQQFSFLENDLITEQQVEGSFSYSALLELPTEDDQPINLNIITPLVGVTIDLPESLRKITEESKLLTLDFSFDETGLIPLRFNYNNELKAAININKQEETTHSANIIYGNGNPDFEPEKGLKIVVNRDKFDPSEWLVLATKLSGDNQEKELKLNKFTIAAEHLHWKNADYGRFEMALVRLDKKWQGEIGSKFAEGLFEFPLQNLEQEKIKITLKSLNLTAIHSIDIPASQTSSDTNLPAFDLISDQVWWNSVNLGKLTIESIKKLNGIKFNNINLASNEHNLTFEGNWTKTGKDSKTKINGHVFANNLGKLLSNLKITDDLINTHAEIDIGMSWQGLPFQFGLTKIDADIDMVLEKGRISSIEPGLGRILGVVAMGQWIKRLSLNFDDIFKQGLSFNDITGQFKLSAGMLTTNDLWVDAIPARISIKGEADLMNKTLNNEILVLPKNTDAIPVAGTIVGGIASMITQVLTDDYKEGYFFGSNYKVTGKWDDLIVSSQPDEDGLFKKTWTGLTDFSWVNGGTTRRNTIKKNNK